MCRIDDPHETSERHASAWLFILFVGVLFLLGFGLSGCAMRTAAVNANEDMQLLLERVHLDAGEIIAHPERWRPAVDSLCTDGMITADQCVRLKAILKAREILVGGRLQESRVRPVDGVGTLRMRFLHPPAKDKSSWSPSLPGEVKAGCEAGQNPQTRILS